MADGAAVARLLTWQMGQQLPASCRSSALGTLPYERCANCTCCTASATSVARSKKCCALTWVSGVQAAAWALRTRA